MRVVTFDEEIVYMAKASQPLSDIAQTFLDTGLRPEEGFRIRVENLISHRSRYSARLVRPRLLGGRLR